MKDYNFGRIILAHISFLANREGYEEVIKEFGLQTIGSYEILAQPKFKRKF